MRREKTSVGCWWYQHFPTTECFIWWNTNIKATYVASKAAADEFLSSVLLLTFPFVESKGGTWHAPPSIHPQESDLPRLMAIFKPETHLPTCHNNASRALLSPRAFPIFTKSSPNDEGNIQIAPAPFADTTWNLSQIPLGELVLLPPGL